MSDKIITRGVAMSVRIHLAELLARKKMTQADLARQTNIRPNTINELYWELVERINLEHLEKICNVLDCQVDELLEIKSDEFD